MDVKFAEVDDFNYSDYRESYLELEEFSNRFLESVLKFSLFPKDYPWPIDPFHNWSRIWEYPFVWGKIKNIRRPDKKNLRIADLGCGLTFFPWFLASKGYRVYALDNNLTLIPSKLITERIKRELYIKGDVFHVASDAMSISLKNNSVDIITHISLLEHLSDPFLSLSEAKRILVKNGSLIITFDVSLDGLAFGDGMPLDLNQISKITKLKFNQIPKSSLRFSNYPKEWTTSGTKLRFSSLNDIWRWKINNEYLRPMVKLISSRLLIKPYSKIFSRAIKLLLFRERFDMWTVMGIAIQKSSISR